jgi:hypothetical protein
VIADAPTCRKIEWGPLIVVVVGALLFLLGAGRFFLRGHFAFVDAIYCCLVLIPAGVLLLVSDYVLHHAKLAAVIPLFLAGVLVFSYPVFDVALGLVLMGAIGGPALGEWKDERRRPKSAAATGGGNEEGE